MNLRRLKYFVKIVDIGSLTKSADILHIAQPALSQQLATLEAEVKQKLVIRTKQGVTPTTAGKVLYGYAQSILRQCEQAQFAIDNSGEDLSGNVSIGLAPGTAAQLLAVPLIEEVKKRHPGIVLYINENYGTTLSELIMNGQMDMAVLYDNREIQGLTFIQLMKEELYFICPFDLGTPKVSVKLSDIARYEFFLPRMYNIMRKTLDDAFNSEGVIYQVKCEIESQITLNSVLAAGMGCTVLPKSAAQGLANTSNAWMAKIVEPHVQTSLSFCMSDHLPLSQPAEAVKTILLSLMAKRNDANQPLTLVG